MKKYGSNIANRRNAVFLRCLILLRIFSDKTGTKIFSILKILAKAIIVKTSRGTQKQPGTNGLGQ